MWLLTFDFIDEFFALKIFENTIQFSSINLSQIFFIIPSCLHDLVDDIALELSYGASHVRGGLKSFEDHFLQQIHFTEHLLILRVYIFKQLSLGHGVLYDINFVMVHQKIDSILDLLLRILVLPYGHLLSLLLQMGADLLIFR